MDLSRWDAKSCKYWSKPSNRDRSAAQLERNLGIGASVTPALYYLSPEAYEQVFHQGVLTLA
jgi:hypothetical protein